MNYHEHVEQSLDMPTATGLLWPAFLVFAEAASSLDVEQSDRLTAEKVLPGQGIGLSSLDEEDQELFQQRMRQVRTYLKLTGILSNPDRGLWVVAESDDPHPQTEDELQRRVRRARREYNQSLAKSRREGEQDDLSSSDQESESKSEANSEDDAKRTTDLTEAGNHGDEGEVEDDNPLKGYALRRVETLRQEIEILTDQRHHLGRELQDVKERIARASNEFDLLREQLAKLRVDIEPLGP